MEPKPVLIELEFARTHEVEKPFGHDFRDQEYQLRLPGGGYVRATLNAGRLRTDLDAFESSRVDAGAFQQMGDSLRCFLGKLDWGHHEATIKQALEERREIHIAVRSAAAELYSLPLELLTLNPSGQPLGLIPGVHFTYEWPQTRTARPVPEISPEGGRVLFAYSAAGGEVPADEHCTALAEVAHAHSWAFNRHEDVLEAVSLPKLKTALDNALRRQPLQPIAALHILCHGGRAATEADSYGLLCDAPTGLENRQVLDAASLQAALSPYAGLIRMVVLCACHGGNVGVPDNHLGSVAQMLHRMGIEAVVASRLPMGVDSSVVLTRALYTGLLSGLPLHRAVHHARSLLRQEARSRDWAGLQLYARAEDGPCFPFTFRPYRGLSPFEARHHRFFFGRTQETNALMRRIEEVMAGTRPRFQMVAGVSGSGKSSLVLAGLVPSLQSTGIWDVRVMRPGDGPSSALCALETHLHHLAEQPAFSPVGTPEAVLSAATRLRQLMPERRLLLVVDQFEEIFTRIEAPDRNAFCRTLWMLCHSHSLQMAVVATFRVDYLGRADEVELDDSTRLTSVVYDDAHRYFVLHLTPPQLREAIAEPAALAGLSQEPGLVEALRDEVGTEPGALPLLQHALDSLWEHRDGRHLTHSAYVALGKVAGALTRKLDDFLATLTPKQQEQARRLLVKLVDFQEESAPATRRRGWPAQLRPQQQEARKDFDIVLEKLVTQRLVVRGDERATNSASSLATAGGWIEIAHESLIRHWPLLLTWVKEDRGKERELRELERWATDWHKANRAKDYLPEGAKLGYARALQERCLNDVSAEAIEYMKMADRQEARRVRLRRAAFAGLAAGLLLLAGLTVFAWSQRREALQRLLQALALADQVMLDINAQLAPVGGTGPLRRALLVKVAKLQDQLLEGAPDSMEALRGRMACHVLRGDVALSHDDTATAHKEYADAAELAQRLAAAEPGNVDRERELAASYERLGLVTLAERKLLEARNYMERGFALNKALSLANPTNLGLMRDLSISHDRLGGLAHVEGRLRDERDHFEQGLALRKALVEAESTNAGYKRDLCVSYSRLGGVAIAEGNLAEARSFFDKDRAITQALVDAEPSNAEFRRSLATTHEWLGDVAQRMGRLDDAGAHLERALELRNALAVADPSNVQLKYELGIGHNLLGNLYQDQGKIVDTRTHRLEALRAFELTAAADPGNFEFRRAVAIGYGMLGDLAWTEGAFGEARVRLETALSHLKSMAAAHPADAELKRDLATTYNKLGTLSLTMRRLADARTHFEQDRLLVKELVGVAPSDAELRRELSVAQMGIGKVAQMGSRLDDALVSYNEALAVRTHLAAQDPSNVDWQLDLAETMLALAEIARKLGDAQTSRSRREDARRVLDGLRSTSAAKTPRFKELADTIHRPQ